MAVKYSRHVLRGQFMLEAAPTPSQTCSLESNAGLFPVVSMYVVYAEEFLRFLSWQHLETNVRNQKQICFFCAGTSAFFKCATSNHLLWKASCLPHPLCLRQAYCDGPELRLLLSCLFSSVGILGVLHTQSLHIPQFHSEPSACCFRHWFLASFEGRKSKATLGISRLWNSGYFTLLHAFSIWALYRLADGFDHFS